MELSRYGSCLGRVRPIAGCQSEVALELETTDVLLRLVAAALIGAGVVLRDPKAQTVEGLTTAATVWATAALGIACALAAWTIVMVGTVLTLGLLISTDLLNRITNRNTPGEADQPVATATTEVP